MAELDVQELEFRLSDRDQAADLPLSLHQSIMNSTVAHVLVLFGAVGVIQLLGSLLYAAYIYLLRPAKNLRRNGSWAIVTGATDGIGRAYCDALAKQGINILLVSRTESKLQTAAAEIGSKFEVQTKIVPMNFGSASKEDWARLEETLTPLEVGTLINNVGLSYDHPDYLTKLNDTFIRQIIEINCLATTMMTQLVIPGMEKRRRGAIVNIGSAASTLLPAGPLLSVYAATKAYVDMLSKSLAAEYARVGITVQNQAPLFVATKLAKIRRPRLDAPSPKVWVHAAIRDVGYAQTSCPYWVHGIICFVMSRVPAALITSYVMNLHLGMRKRFYKKQATKTQ